MEGEGVGTGGYKAENKTSVRKLWKAGAHWTWQYPQESESQDGEAVTFLISGRLY